MLGKRNGKHFARTDSTCCATVTRGLYTATPVVVYGRKARTCKCVLQQQRRGMVTVHFGGLGSCNRVCVSHCPSGFCMGPRYLCVRKATVERVLSGSFPQTVQFSGMIATHRFNNEGIMNSNSNQRERKKVESKLFRIRMNMENHFIPPNEMHNGKLWSSIHTEGAHKYFGSERENIDSPFAQNGSAGPTSSSEEFTIQQQ